MCQHEQISEEEAEDSEDEDSEYEDEEDDEDHTFIEANTDESIHDFGMRWRRIGIGRWLVDEEYEPRDYPEIPHYDGEVHALWVMRETFSAAEEGRSITAVKKEAGGGGGSSGQRNTTKIVRSRMFRSELRYPKDGYESA